MKFPKFLKSLTILSIGLVVGWTLHGQIIKQSDSESEIEVITLNANQPRPEAPQPDFEKLDQTGNVLATEDHRKNTAAVPQVTLEKFESALVNGESRLAISLCNELIISNNFECRQTLIKTGKSSLENGFISELLNLWLFDHPDDIDVTVLLVNKMIEDELFVDAAKRLKFVRGYQTQQKAIETVSWEVQRLARAAMMKLNLREDFVTLKSLLRIFTEIEPDRATWRYSLARVLIDMNDFNEALEELTYIMFDPDYGDRASELYEQVSQRISLADYSVASLQRSGAQFLVPVRVNRIHELILLLDTGASLTSIRADKLRELGLAPESGQEIVLNTAGGQIRSNLIGIRSLSVGGQPIRDLQVASLEFFDGEADGLLGMDYLRHFKFVIDQANRSLHLTPK